jgi:predicted deacylase
VQKAIFVMKTLLDAITWHSIPLPGEAVTGQVPLAIGTVGEGKPVASITAGIHGDEGPWGAWAIRKLLESTTIELLVGTLRIVPCANPLAVQADTRNAPLDSLDLNRSFPGNRAGSHTEVLAAILAEELVAGCDLVIDLHGGGSWCVNAFAFEMPGGEAISRAFGAPFVVKAPERSVTLTGYARTHGATISAVEMGGRGVDEDRWATRIADGLRRALTLAGVLGGEADDPPTRSLPVGSTTVLRPQAGGLFIPSMKTDAVGTIVRQGSLLGEVIDPATLAVKERITAPFPNTALLLLRPHIARLEGGAMTYVVAEPLE